MAGATFTGLSVEVARRKLAALLREHGYETPELDARLLLGEALGLDLTGLARHALRKLTEDESARVKGFTARRLSGEPVARILGVKEFWGLALQVSPATLVPRPDTETVVEAALDFLRTIQRSAPRIADIGTGTGAIILALLSELPDATGVATDISTKALAIAQANARTHNLHARVAFREGDYTTALTGAYDLIVSNPPYIRTSDITKLDRNVREHDPRIALDGGEDGLVAYRILVRDAPRLLVPGGALVVEVGHDQAADVAALMRDGGLATDIAPRPDLAGILRVVTGVRPTC